MTELVWDEIGERVYETGVDRGVLYLHDGTAVAWNGITNVEESSDSELKSFYLDGVKYLQYLVSGDFVGKLSAFTYPDEFNSVIGVGSLNPGFFYYDQPAKSFNLSYRTKVGNDLDGLEFGYKIHILYNLLANSDSHSFKTEESNVEPIEFSWALTGTPPRISGFRPTVHIEIDSRTTPPDVLQILEDTLYGTSTSNGSLPSIQEIAEYFGYLGALIIVDHGDGSWSAIDESDTYIAMLDSTTFKIDNADVTIIDPVTYQISSTNVG
jgi:hypothetical protein